MSRHEQHDNNRLNRRAFIKGVWTGSLSASVSIALTQLGIRWYQDWGEKRHEKWADEAMAEFKRDGTLRWAVEKLELLQRILKENLSETQSDFCIRVIREKFQNVLDPQKRETIKADEAEVIHFSVVVFFESISYKKPVWVLPQGEMRKKLESWGRETLVREEFENYLMEFLQADKLDWDSLRDLMYDPRDRDDLITAQNILNDLLWRVNKMSEGLDSNLKDRVMGSLNRSGFLPISDERPFRFLMEDACAVRRHFLVLDLDYVQRKLQMI